MRGTVFSSQDSLRLWFMPRVSRGNAVGHTRGGHLQMGGIHPTIEGAYCYFCLLFGNLKRGQAATGSAACPWPVAPGALAACVPGGSCVLPAAGLPPTCPGLCSGWVTSPGFRLRLIYSVNQSPDAHLAYVVPDVLSLLLPRGALGTLLTCFISESSVRMPCLRCSLSQRTGGVF